MAHPKPKKPRKRPRPRIRPRSGPKGGRPRHAPTQATREQVMLSTVAGDRQEQIAESLGISVPTLHEYYRREINLGTLYFKRRAVGVLAHKMKSKNEYVSLDAAKFTLRTKGGWAEHTANANLNVQVDASKEPSLSDQILSWSVAEGAERGAVRLPIAALPAPVPVIPIREKSRTPPTGSPDNSGNVIDSTATRVPDEQPPRGAAKRAHWIEELADDEPLSQMEELRRQRSRFPGEL